MTLYARLDCIVVQPDDAMPPWSLQGAPAPHSWGPEPCMMLYARIWNPSEELVQQLGVYVGGPDDAVTLALVWGGQGILDHSTQPDGFYKFASNSLKVTLDGSTCTIEAFEPEINKPEHVEAVRAFLAIDLLGALGTDRPIPVPPGVPIANIRLK